MTVPSNDMNTLSKITTKVFFRGCATSLLIPIVALAGSVSAHGATISWSGAVAGGSWPTGGNWVGGTAPNNSISTSTGDFAQFFSTISGRMPNVAGTRSINGMSFSNRNWQLNNTTVGGILSVGGNGIAVASQRTVDLNTLIRVNSQSWTTTGSAILNVNQAVTEVDGGPFILTKGGGGTMNINAGFAVGTLSLAGGFTVLGANNLLGDSMSIVNTTAANLNLNGFSDSVGTLLTGSGDLALNFGSISGANSFSFADSSALSWGAGILIVQNFENGIDTLRFGTSSSGLSEAQLSQIQFDVGGPLAQIDDLGFVTPASGVSPYNAWVAFWQTNSAGFTDTAGNADPDGDGFVNDVEFAFDGDPTVGTPALMTVTPVGSNAVFNWVESTNGVVYTVQTNSTLTNAWTAAAGLTISNSANTNNVLLAPTYVRKEFIITNATGKEFYRVQATIAP